MLDEDWANSFATMGLTLEGGAEDGSPRSFFFNSAYGEGGGGKVRRLKTLVMSTPGSTERTW